MSLWRLVVKIKDYKNVIRFIEADSSREAVARVFSKIRKETARPLEVVEIKNVDDVKVKAYQKRIYLKKKDTLQHAKKDDNTE